MFCDRRESNKERNLNEIDFRLCCNFPHAKWQYRFFQAFDFVTTAKWMGWKSISLLAFFFIAMQKWTNDAYEIDQSSCGYVKVV